MLLPLLFFSSFLTAALPPNFRAELSESGALDNMLLAGRARGSSDTQTRGVRHCPEPSSDGPTTGNIAPFLTTTNLNGDHGQLPSEPLQGRLPASLLERAHVV